MTKQTEIIECNTVKYNSARQELRFEYPHEHHHDLTSIEIINLPNIMHGTSVCKFILGGSKIWDFYLEPDNNLLAGHCLPLHHVHYHSLSFEISNIENINGPIKLKIEYDDDELNYEINDDSETLECKIDNSYYCNYSVKCNWVDCYDGDKFICHTYLHVDHGMCGKVFYGNMCENSKND